MAENSEVFQSTVKPRTKKTVALTPDQALEILQQSVINCQQAGLAVRVMPIYDAGERLLTIVLAGVAIKDGYFAFASTGKAAE